MSRTPKNIALVPFCRGLAFLSLVALSLSWSPQAIAGHKPNHGGGGKPGDGGGKNEASSVDVTVFGDMFGDTRRTRCVSKSSFVLRDSHLDLSFLIPPLLFPCFSDPAEISPQVPSARVRAREQGFFILSQAGLRKSSGSCERKEVFSCSE